MNAVTKRNRVPVLLAFAAVYLIWGSTYLAIRYAVETIPPYILGAIRFVIAGLILYVVAVWQGAPRPTRAELRTAAVTGVLMLALGNGAVNFAETTVPSGIVALIVSTVPLWMVLVDWLRPGGRRPHRFVFAGLALGLGGMLVLVGPGIFTGNGHVPAGMSLLLLLGSLSWAVGSIATRHGARPRSALMATALQMIFGGLGFVAIALSLGEFASLHIGAIGMRAAIGALYLTFVGSLVAFTAYIYLLGAVSAAKAGTYAYVNPIIAVLLGWLVAGEPIGPRTLVAAAIILSGVAIITITQHNTPSTTGEQPVPAPPVQRERSAA
jgi:drug/metabolite transporter (DMT)-like permease